MGPESNWRVLVIDDEEDIRDVLTMALTDTGCSVQSAPDGVAGLALCKRFDPQIVITDIRMPRLDGLQVLERIKQEQPGIEVIVATAFGDMQQAIRALQLDASDFITKPIGTDALMVALQRAQQRYTLRRELSRQHEQQMADQARLLHQDKMMSLGRLAASVVHEINNPLSGILNYIRLMARILGKGPLDPERKAAFSHYVEVVEKETERVSKIVSGLLAFSRKSPPSFGEVVVEELLSRSLALSRHKLELQNIAVTESIAPGLAPIKGDFNQLQQCVINLIFNAIDAMPSGGTLSLSAWQEPGTSQVALAVADTGCGIDPQTLARIFEPFFTTKNEGYGVGLGLSTTYGIVERHGGRIEVHSEPGNGTVLTMHLPEMPAG